MSNAESVVYRDAVADDVPFIYSSWLNGLRYGNDWFNLIERSSYYKTYHKVIETILTRPGTKVKVACLKDDPEVILGYCAYSGTILHWVQVKDSWKGIGLARALIPTKVTVVTHVTKVGASLLRSKLPSAVFNPFVTD